MNKVGDDIFNYEEYNAQSLVVRGNKMADKDFKKSLTDKIIGRVIFNKRLKGGEGYLITNNQHNKDLFNITYNSLNKTTEPTSEITETKQQVVEINTPQPQENKNFIENQHKEETLKINMNKLDEKPVEIKQLSKELVKEHKRRSFDSDDSDSDSDFKHKMRQRSKEKQYKKYVSSSSDSESSEPSKKRRSKKYSKPKSSKSYKHKNKRRYSYSSSSSSQSSSSDSLSSDSEDERIQKVIKRKSNNKSNTSNPKIKIDSEIIDSDEEDIVTLARRLRYVLSEVKRK
jgi:hypothetical protein